MDHSVDTVAALRSSPQAQDAGSTCDDSESVKQNAAYPDKSSISSPPQQSLTDHVLHFCSAASNEAIVAAGVCLAAVTVILFGRIGLVLVGIVAGIILHASWGDAYLQSHGGVPRRELARRLLDWPKKEFEDNEISQDTALSRRSSRVAVDYSKLPPATAAALNSLTDAIIRDYVKYWYTPILPSEASFPDSCQRTLTAFISSMSSHLSRKRPTDTFLQFLMNSSSMIIVFLSELSAALGAGLPVSSTPEEAISNYLQQNPDSSLANVLAAEQQRKKLNMVADDILASFLDVTAYRCEPVRHFLREVFAGVVLEAVIKSCSSPQFINSWIVYLLEEGEPELMNAIDAGVEGARKDGNVATSSAPIDERIRTTSSEGRVRSESLPSPSFNLETTKGGDATAQTTNGRAYKSMSLAIEDVSESAKKDLLHNGRDAHYTIKDELISRHSSDDDDTRERGGGDGKENAIPTEIPRDGSEQTSNKKGFTDFDQLLPQKLPTSPQSQPTAPQAELTPQLTLHSASVSIDDLSESGDKGSIRAKPSGDYALQIEPASSRYPGWIVFRKYSDFESLHEVLGPISRLNHIHDFVENHPALPTWKGKTKQTLKQGLENYLRDALRHETLAESERMRRFLGKDRNLDAAPKTPLKSGFSFPGQTAFEGVGKGVLEVLTNAPKGVAGSSKSVFGGVTGVFGVSGNKRSSSLSIGRQSPPATLHHEAAARSADGNVDKDLKNDRHLSTPNLPSESNADIGPRTSMDSTRGSLKSLSPSSPECDSAPNTLSESDTKRDHTGQDTFDRNELEREAQTVSLSRPPTEIPRPSDGVSASIGSSEPETPSPAVSLSTAGGARSSLSQGPTKAEKASEKTSSLSSEEAQMAVELIFAVINELYTLSSAWNFRKTLLNAAKSYILRPGNPNLEAIRALLQESVIETYTKDETLADQIKKLRENCLPTEDELKTWPPPPNDNEQEKLRNNARKLLVERGMPQALVSVMGAAATGEALGKVFDCLQIEVVARGFVFALLLQALKTATL
ncbi:hypothetical protein DTO282F9_7963 [Paecilomyces variotii]|nr:hypothetical protein DTO282F9_7963 [Paecilomyces variotii]